MFTGGGRGKTLVLTLVAVLFTALALAAAPFGELDAQSAPAAPTDLQPSVTNTTITLSWSAVTGATGYEVKQGASGTETAVPSASGTSYTFNGLAGGAEYTLYVRAKKGSETSAWSSPVNASIPGLTVIAATRDSITLSWSAVAGATSYEVKAGADGAITAVTSGRSHAFTGLPAGASGWTHPWFGYEHTLYVRGKNATSQVFPWRMLTARTIGLPASGAVVTSSSTAVTLGGNAYYGTLPPPPCKFKLGPRGAVTTVLSILGLSDPYNPDQGGTPPAQGDSCTFTGLTSATTYTITRTQDSGVYTYTLHASPTGRVDSATVRLGGGGTITTWNGWLAFATAPAPPSGLSVTPNGEGLTLSWDATPGATRYDVRLGADGLATTVPSAATSYTFTGLTPSTEYRLYVHARNGGGASEWKSIAATTLGTLTSPPSSVTVTDATATSIKLSWDAVVGATSYEVRRDGGTATAAASNASHEFTSLTAETEYTLSVRGKTGTVAFPWRSITAKTEPSPSRYPVYVTPTITTLAVFAVPYSGSSAGVGSVERDNGGTRVAAPQSVSNLTADTEYTLYFRTTSESGSVSNWRSITVKTLPSAGSDFRTASFGPGLTPRFTSAVHIGGQTEGPYPFGGSYANAYASAGFYINWINSGTEHTFYERTVNSAGTVEWATHTVTTAPVPPTRLSATATSASLTLRWAVVPGATAYRVKLGESGTPTTVTGASHEFTGLTAGTEYTLYVYAQNRGGNSEWSSITASTAGPPAPSGLSKTATSTTITLSWSAVTGATGYDVKQGATGTETAVSSGTSYTFSNLTASTEYTLYVRARNSAGVSDWKSLSATTAPAQPSGLNVMSSSTGLTLSWNIVDGATGYDVKQGATGTVTSVAAVARRKIEVGLGTGLTMTATVSGVSHVFTDLTSNTAYTLYVRTKNSGGNSEWTSLSATTAPAAPSGLSATATNTSLTLSWNAVTGATGYDVSLGSSSPAVSASGTSHTFSDLSAGTTYRLDVRARNGSGFSDWTSLTASTTTAPAAPSAPSKGAATDTTIALSWGAVADATSYEVKIATAGADDKVEPVSSGASHTVNDLTADTEYTLSVRAKNSSGASSPWGPTLKATTAPPPPTNLRKRSASDKAINLNWNAVASVTGYEVKIAAAGKDDRVETVSLAEGLSYTVDELAANTEYTLSMRSKNGNGSSGWSSALKVTTASPTPTGLRKTSATDTTISLTWSAAARATGYDVKITTARAADREESVPAASGVSHTVKDLTPNTEYILYVRSRNGNGKSLWSSQRIAIKVTTAPPAPSLSVEPTNTTLKLSWNAVAGAASYEISGNGISFIVSADAWRRTFDLIFDGLAAGTEYTLSARSKNKNGASDWSTISASTSSP